MEIKKVAMVIGILVLLPLFIGLFVDAVYEAPKYEDYCNNTMYPSYKEPKANVNCPDTYLEKEAQNCMNQRGEVRIKYDSNNCQVFDSCDMCSANYNNDNAVYNRNIFFILAPIGLVIIVLGIYLTVDYIGAAMMFGGLITLFYATMRYFTDMSKLLRAFVILIELLIIMWIGYKKIGIKQKKKK